MRRRYAFAGRVDNIFYWRTGADIGHIHYGMPVAKELTDLLRIHIQQQRDAMRMVQCFGLDIRQVEPAS